MSDRDAKRWRIPSYDVSDVSALQALSLGNATPEQQKQALKWIVNSASGAYDHPFDLDNSQLTAHYVGRMFVGQQIVKLINLPLHTLKSKENNRHE